jgi:hypothetical protein
LGQVLCGSASLGRDAERGEAIGFKVNQN